MSIDVCQAEHAQQIQELKLGISRRDIDISRLREIRDQQQAELNERRQKDMKLTSLEEFKKLAHTRGVRTTNNASISLRPDLIAGVHIRSARSS